jgi:hypothetical protein
MPMTKNDQSSTPPTLGYPYTLNCNTYDGLFGQSNFRLIVVVGELSVVGPGVA